MSAPDRFDVVTVGAGILGLATAQHILMRDPTQTVLVLEKEPRVGLHQTGHNSGVIHRGIYYAPGSLKARLCVDGARRLTAFCDAHEIPYRLPGKLIVASDETELASLRELQRRGETNGVEGLRWLDSEQIADVEPHAVGIAALHSPGTGIVDYGQVAAAYADEIRNRGGTILLGARVKGMTERTDHVEVRAGNQVVRASIVVTCAGLQADRLARMTANRPKPEMRIVPFRGDYYYLNPARAGLVRGLIYPVPDARFPFLGVHFTPRIDGSILLGPNAVLAFAREGYRRRDVSVRDLGSTLTFAGFWRLAARHWRTGAGEMWRDLSRRAYANALRRYIPDIRRDDLIGHASGVRAQAVSADGSIIDDFQIMGEGRVVHVGNAPSPAATSSLAIGEFVADRVFQRLSEL